MNLVNALFSAGWIGPVVTALIMILSGIYINRKAKTEAEKVSRAAYEGAIEAMKKQVDALKEHIDVLQERMKDAELESKRMRETTETIIDLLKSRDIHITVQGHMVTIREGKDTVVTRIRKEEESV